MIDLSFLQNIKNIIYFSLIAILFICYIYLSYIPHYDKNATFKLLSGTYYTKSEAILNENYSQVESKFKELHSLYIQSQEQNTQLLNDKNKLNSQNDMFKSQLKQQEQFIQEQSQEIIQKKEQTEIDKKASFSNVSMNTITNDRPKLGNMISKNIKQFESN